ncbi:hypothetical protein NE237_021665 [Protea cynaroides]|uniref:Reverse transcriptase n=1 Tax=Protea cynaroides TaxID=273540 RepID=A0A9Q0H9I8_9MAGN|nr:hypothetical protein NE237_021665 [Protea cynaroides]
MMKTARTKDVCYSGQSCSVCVLATNCLHLIKHKRRGKYGLMSIILDMNKAYDRLEWDFLRKTHLAFGCTQIGCRVMFCVESAEMAIVFNGSPLPYFRLSRGLRQGNPFVQRFYPLTFRPSDFKIL